MWSRLLILAVLCAFLGTGLAFTGRTRETQTINRVSLRLDKVLGNDPSGIIRYYYTRVEGSNARQMLSFQMADLTPSQRTTMRAAATLAVNLAKTEEEL